MHERACCRKVAGLLLAGRSSNNHTVSLYLQRHVLSETWRCHQQLKSRRTSGKCRLQVLGDEVARKRVRSLVTPHAQKCSPVFALCRIGVIASCCRVLWLQHAGVATGASCDGRLGTPHQSPPEDSFVSALDQTRNLAWQVLFSDTFVRKRFLVRMLRSLDCRSDGA